MNEILKKRIEEAELAFADREYEVGEIDHDALCNEIDFLQREIDRYREQNKNLVKMIFKLKNKYENKKN